MAGGPGKGRLERLFAVAFGLPDQAKLPDIGTNPAQQLTVAQHAAERAILMRRSFGFDDFVDRAAFAGELCHAAIMRPPGTERYVRRRI